MAPLKCFELDRSLPHDAIHNRVNGYKHWKGVFEKNEGGMQKFADGYKIFGMNRNADDTGFIFREYLPGAKQVFLIGEFNKWENRTPLRNEGFGRWMVELPDVSPGEYMVPHMTKYKIRLESNDGSWHDRVPAWAKLAWQDGNKLFDAAMWEPPASERYQFKHPNPPKVDGLKIYESHVGMSSPECKINTYLEFADTVLPRIKKLGYNAIQLMAVAEHAYYGCFGYHVTSFFAPSSRFGTPEELKYLVDRAHGMGIQVLVDLVHAHCSSNAADGIAMLDGTDHCYTHGGALGYHTQWDSRLFNYESYETLRFLLSNVKYWLTEFRFDGFRFDGVSSMLYKSHAINQTAHDYFGPDADIAGHIYLMLANDVIKTTLPSAITVAEDVSGMPTVALPIEWGGFGFDARLAMAIPDMWIKILKEIQCDEAWSMKWIAGELQNRRKCERSIAYAESHDQAIVGDKTVAFWLMDAEMYTGMSLLQCPSPSPCIERGLALHKMIRMVCIALGEGYLNFHGNEFGHPEWVDFPREGNGWSYHHANRRYDLADADHLRYKFFNDFDMYMQQCENRFKFLSDWHYHCTLVSDEDKVIAIERGECLIIFNFHPCNSYSDYRIGCKWDEPLRTVLDSDEGHFGGLRRLEWGHANSFPVGDGWHNRNHSVKVYMPSRTVQVLVPERHLQGGVKIMVDASLLENVPSISSAAELTVTLLDAEWENTKRHWKEGKEYKFDEKGMLHLPDMIEAHFILRGPDGEMVKCAADFEGYYHCLFPGLYSISRLGCIEALSPWESAQLETEVEAEAKVEQSVMRAKLRSESRSRVRGRGEAKSAKDEVEATAAEEKAANEEVKACDEPVAAEVDRSDRDIQCSPTSTKGWIEEEDQVVAADSEQRAEEVMEEAKAESKEAPPLAEKTEEEATATSEEAPAPEKETKDEKPAEDSSVGEANGSTQETVSGQQAEDPSETKGEVVAEEDMVKYPSMLRFPSMHFLGPEDALAESAEAPVRQISNLDIDTVRADSQSYKSFGLHRQGDVWVFREWLPQAEAAFLVGEFNGWNTDATPLQRDEALDGVWKCEIASPQSEQLQKGQKYKLFVKDSEGKCSYVTPAWATKMVFTADVKVMDAIVWPVQAKAPQQVLPAKETELIYECHLGLAHRPGQPKSWNEAAEVVIPRAVGNGYTALLLVGVQECQNYSEMGVRPCVYFAPSSSLGEPEELQDFVAKAHSAGLRVYMNVAHDGAVWSDDALGDQYFRTLDSVDAVTGCRIFDYDKEEVVRYLTSSLSFWMTEYGFDGFKFLNVSSMIYTRRGRWLPEDVAEFEDYVMKPGMIDESAVRYLKMANTVVHEQGKLSGKAPTTIAEDSSMFPGLCGVEDGGVGFDICQTDKAATHLRKILKQRDEDWSMGELIASLTPLRDTPLLASTEASKECVVSRKPLKIAMLAWETLHTIAVGGVAPHVTELSAALHGAGHEVHIFTRAQGSNIDHEILGVHYHEVNYDKHGCMVQDVRNMCGAFVAALYGHESVWGAFDIVHGHDWLAGPGIQQLKGQGKRCVFTMHSTEGGRNGDMHKGHPGIKEVERCACGAADKLIAVSGVLKEEVQSACGADGGKMRVIYNGIHAGPIVNMEWQDEWTGNTKMDKGWSPMDPMFLFVGRHTAQKGCDIFIEAIPNILRCRGDAKFVIVGDGHLKAHNEGRAHALGVTHAICFTGSLKSGSAHLKALFRACDAVVVPSRNEPFGIVVLEAWASGKPVVATTSGGPRDFVKPDQDGYLVSPDSGSVAWGCCKILENFEHARWMGRNAQAKAIREFSWEHIARETEDVYYELLNLKNAPRTESIFAGYSLSNALLRERCFNMSIADGDAAVARGLSILKVTKLLVASLAGKAVMTWMGNEFAQIDIADMPRPGNGFNDECSRVKYELADNDDLKFKQMAAFEATLNTMAKRHNWLACPKHEMLTQCEESKLVAFTRGTCLFVFNLHPTKDLHEYAVSLPAALAGSPLACVLNTDEAQFAGSANSLAVIAAAQKQRGYLKMNLRSRSAVILAPAEKQMGA